ncbi:MAG TPA: DEAD/DEAH box helicase, partial [Candidatus Dormibacteraeota bacterium]|nr:DEAD/DEAH box helicase [Candidatus Dormibacteraeota bacterium]
ATLAAERFGLLGLGPDCTGATARLGYQIPTAIQERAIPVLLAGRDLIAQAPTGTGKTVAYGLPIVERLKTGERLPQALVVVPTRELAIQVAGALGELGRARGLVALPVYGGQPYDRQLRALARGVHVVVGTPGRLLDHLARATLVLDAVRTIVLDEADEMLDMGFVEDIERLLAALPDEHQTALFSATIPERVRRLAGQYLREPERVSVQAGGSAGQPIRQVCYEVAWPAKADALVRILECERPGSAIVFVRRRGDADMVAEHLTALGYSAQAIHGDISQNQRERVLAGFRAGTTGLLVGTDVAGRGLDIPHVSHVINYDMPADAEVYVHRIGRTGRAGQTGTALTLVTPRERRSLALLEQHLHLRLERRRLPSDTELERRRREAFRDEVLRSMERDEGDDGFRALVDELAATHDPVALAAVALRMAAERNPAFARSRFAVQAVRPPEPPDRPAALETPTRQPGRGGSHAGHHGRPLARLFLRVGREQGVRAADLVGAIANEAGLPSRAIGEITLHDRFSFVDVPEDLAARVEAVLNRTSIRGHPPRATRARPLLVAGSRPASKEHRNPSF